MDRLRSDEDVKPELFYRIQRIAHALDRESHDLQRGSRSVKWICSSSWTCRREEEAYTIVATIRRE